MAWICRGELVLQLDSTQGQRHGAGGEKIMLREQEGSLADLDAFASFLSPFILNFQTRVASSSYYPYSPVNPPPHVGSHYNETTVCDP